MINKVLSDKEIEKKLAYVKASLAIEDLDLTDGEIKILRKYIKGELTKEQVYKIFNI